METFFAQTCHFVILSFCQFVILSDLLPPTLQTATQVKTSLAIAIRDSLLSREDLPVPGKDLIAMIFVSYWTLYKIKDAYLLKSRPPPAALTTQEFRHFQKVRPQSAHVL